MQVLAGKRAVNVSLVPSPGEEAEQEKLRKLSMQYLEGKTILPVIILDAEQREQERGSEASRLLEE